MSDTPTSPPGFRDGIEAAAVLMETHLCDYGTREDHGIVPLRPTQFVTPGMKSRAAAIRAIPTPDTLPTGWNSDMGEAPRDRDVLLTNGRECVVASFWERKGYEWCPWVTAGGHFAETWPTAWMPLPLPLPLPPPPPGETSDV